MRKTEFDGVIVLKSMPQGWSSPCWVIEWPKPLLFAVYIYIYIGVCVLLRSYMGITISHYKDPHEQTSIMGCHNGFERCSIGLGYLFMMHQLLISGEFCDLATDSWDIGLRTASPSASDQWCQRRAGMLSSLMAGASGWHQWCYEG